MITQLRAASEMPRSFWIRGSATTAIMPSIVAINCIAPIAVTAATNQRDGSLVEKDLRVRPGVVGSTGIGLVSRVVSSSYVLRLCTTESPHSGWPTKSLRSDSHKRDQIHIFGRR